MGPRGAIGEGLDFAGEPVDFAHVEAVKYATQAGVDLAAVFVQASEFEAAVAAANQVVVPLRRLFNQVRRLGQGSLDLADRLHGGGLVAGRAAAGGVATAGVNDIQRSRGD